jgi:hypothetical protein
MIESRLLIQNGKWGSLVIALIQSVPPFSYEYRLILQANEWDFYPVKWGDKKRDATMFGFDGSCTSSLFPYSLEADYQSTRSEQQ